MHRPLTTLSLCASLLGCGAAASDNAALAAPPSPPAPSPAPPPAPDPASAPALRAGPAPAPPPERAPDPAPASSHGVPGANLHVGAVTADGIKLTDLSCKLDGALLLGPMLVAGALAQQRAALVACGLSPDAPVAFTFRGGAVTDASAESGDERRDACLAKAIRRARGAADATCRGRLGLP